MNRRNRPDAATLVSTREDRFGGVYERWHAPVTAYCRRRLHPSQVDDAVAETFEVAWRRIDEVPAGREALLWLYRVAYRVVGHTWRGDGRRRRLGRRLADQPTAVAAPADVPVLVDEDCRRVVAALDRMRVADAELLRLVAWEGLSAGDLAAVLDVRPNTASQRLRRARAQLVREFDRLDDEPASAPAARREGGR